MNFCVRSQFKIEICASPHASVDAFKNFLCGIVQNTSRKASCLNKIEAIIRAMVGILKNNLSE